MEHTYDSTVSSSQDGVLDFIQVHIPISETEARNNQLNMNAHLKVAKVLPTLRIDDKTELEDEDDEEEDEEEGEEEEEGEDVVMIEEPTNKVKKQTFPWLSKFNDLCKNAIGCHSFQPLNHLMDFYIRNICQDVKKCYKKKFRASKLRLKMSDNLRMFHMMYSKIKQPLANDCYLDKMSDLLSMYLDMEIKGSRRSMENPKKIAGRITSTLFLLLQNSKSHMMNVVLKTRFFIKAYKDICIPVIMKILEVIPDQMNDVSYIQYILVFKKWKTLVSREEERKEINLKASRMLLPPLGFADEYHTSDKYSGLLPFIPKGKREKITLWFMQGPELDAKLTSEGYASNVEWSSEEELKMKSTLPKPKEEYHFLHYNDTPKGVSRKEPIESKLLIELSEKMYADSDDSFADELVAGEFLNELNKKKIMYEAEVFEQTSKSSPKSKNIQEEDESRGFQPKSSLPRRSPESLGFSTAANIDSVYVPEYNVENITSSQKRLTGKEVAKMEADSQSQDEIVFVGKVYGASSDIKPDPENCLEEFDPAKRDVPQTQVLRAVVRPENIEQLSINGFKSGVNYQNLDGNEEEGYESESRDEEILLRLGQELANVEETDISDSEDDIVKTNTASAVEVQLSSSKEMKASCEMVEEQLKMTSFSDEMDQLWQEIDGEDLLSQVFNWPSPHDNSMALYDRSGNITNYGFNDSFSDQQDVGLMMRSLPHMSLNDPVMTTAYCSIENEFKASSSREDLSETLMANDVNNSFQDKSSYALDTQVQKQQDKSIQSKKNSTSKKPGKKVKTGNQNPSISESDALFEKFTKVSPVKEKKGNSKKEKQAQPVQKRKRGRLTEQDERIEEAKQEPLSKKKRGRKRNSPPPPPLRPVSPPRSSPPPPPPPANKKKPRGRPQNPAPASKQKSQSRRK